MLAAGRVPPREPALPAEMSDSSLTDVSQAHAVSAKVAVKAPIQLVFAHWTTPELMDSGLGTGSSCDPRDGGVFAFTSIHGLMVRSAHEAVLPPRLLIFEWDFDEAQVPSPSSQLGQTVVTFSSRHDHTDLAVTQVATSPRRLRPWPGRGLRAFRALPRPPKPMPSNGAAFAQAPPDQSGVHLAGAAAQWPHGREAG